MVTSHKVLHSIHSTKSQGLVLKLDYEKAFDFVNLDFLEELLQCRGFGGKWFSWMHKITRAGSVGVKISAHESDFFLTSKGLRQGDPLSPLLFNLVVDVLTKAASHNLVRGLCPDVFPGGIMCLQYADDTILFLEKDVEKVENLNLVLSCFEQVSGMRISCDKSELISIDLYEYLFIF